MEHPTPEEWLEAIEGEATPELDRRLKAHRESCPECAAQYSALSQTYERLRDLDFPPQAAPMPVRRPWWAEWRFAAAAAVLLGLGLLLGRRLGPGAADPARLQAEVTAGVRAELGRNLGGAVEAILEQDLKTVLTAPAEALTNGFQLALRRALDQTAADASATATRRLRVQLDQVAAALRAESLQDQRATLARFDDLQGQTEAQLVGLRTDLESLATQADRQLRLTGRELRQIASTGHP